MRDRECSIYDTRNFEKPLKSIRVDSNSGTLWPLVDRSRGLVYLTGRVGLIGTIWLTLIYSHS